jgi:hypothetical protein
MEKDMEMDRTESGDGQGRVGSHILDMFVH